MIILLSLFFLGPAGEKYIGQIIFNDSKVIFLIEYISSMDLIKQNQGSTATVLLKYIQHLSCFALHLASQQVG